MGLRAMRKRQLLLVAALAAAGLGLLGDGRANAAPRPALPPQGIYEYCAPLKGPHRCLARLRRIAEGGFRVVVNYEQLHSTRAQLLTYARTAKRLGVKIVWPLKEGVWWAPGGDPVRAHPALAVGCRCRERAALIRWFVRLVRDLLATWGYYVGDETDPAAAPEVGAFTSEIRRLDPRHPRLFIAQGENPQRDLAPFGPVADMIGVDWYPVGLNLPLSSVRTVNQEAARISRAHGRSRAAVLQAFSWAQYSHPAATAARWPSRHEMRRMRDLALRAARPRLLLWYSYFDIQRSRYRAARWRALRWAAFGRR